MKKLLSISFLMFTAWCLNAAVSGTVVNKSNQGIPYALVSKQSNPNVWAKTDENGKFTIDLNAGDKVKVAGYQYETRNNVSLSNNISITLQPDALLSTDVMHISFDHIKPGIYLKDEFIKDFPAPSAKGMEASGDEQRAFIDKNESLDPNGTSLRVRYPKGGAVTNGSGIDARIPLSGDFKNDDFEGDEMYVSYWIKFPAGTDFKCGGKLPSLGGDTYDASEDKNGRWKGRIMWRIGGSVNMYMELPHDQFDVATGSSPTDEQRMMGGVISSDGCVPADRYTSYFGDGEWHNVEMHYKLDNGPGSAPGIFEVWIDGDVGYKSQNSSLFNYYKPNFEAGDKFQINYFLLSTFYGGSSSPAYLPTKDEFSWIDEVRVSRTRVNEYSRYRSVTAINSNTSREELAIYPNPSATGLFNLAQSSNWEVYGISGNLIAQGSGEQVDLSSQNAGIYFISIDGLMQKLIVE